MISRGEQNGFKREQNVPFTNIEKIDILISENQVLQTLYHVNHYLYCNDTVLNTNIPLLHGFTRNNKSCI